MNGILLELGLAVVTSFFAFAFGYAFRSPALAQRSVDRLGERIARFRVGLLMIIGGIIAVSEAHAVRWVSGISVEHSTYVNLILLGYGLILIGVGTVDSAVWFSSPRSDANY